MKPRRIADLYCCAGGAAKGLHEVFPFAEIVGFDISPQPHYPYAFVQQDALTVDLHRFDFVWASPPCQRHSRLNGINRVESYPDLIAATREKLVSWGMGGRRPWIIENVMGAPLYEPFILCGSMFGLGVWRHRQFEHGGWGFRPFQHVPQCHHELCPEPLDVTGTGGPCLTRNTPGGGLHRKPRNMEEARLAMGIDWMLRREIVQAIPPAYSRWIAEQLTTRFEGSTNT